jgi:hypothetical protein
MLAGFFTYKGAVVARQSISLFEELTRGYTKESPQGIFPENDDDNIAALDSSKKSEDASSTKDNLEEQAMDVTSVDRAFNRNMLFK